MSSSKGSAAKPRRGSPAGFHFMEEFKNCKRKWYYHHLLGWEPDRKPFQLIFGGCFHRGKEVFYKTGSASKAVKAYAAELKETRSELEDPSRFYETLLARGQIMLMRWIDRLGKNDLKVYKILGVEQEETARLPNGYMFTFRIDVAMKTPGGSVYIFDTKTSWYSANLQSEQVETSDQGTAYLYGWNQLHKNEPAVGLIPDCIYWNLNTEDPEKIACTRASLVRRSAEELNSWATGAMMTFKDMALRVRALKTEGVDATFDRTTSYCLSYNRKCEYLDVCRGKIKGIPPGFHEEEWSGKKAFLRMVK